MSSITLKTELKTLFHIVRFMAQINQKWKETRLYCTQDDDFLKNNTVTLKFFEHSHFLKEKNHVNLKSSKISNEKQSLPSFSNNLRVVVMMSK